VTWTIFLALALIAGAGLYIFLRWRRSPKAYKAMIAIAVASFVSGSILSAWVFRLRQRPIPPPVGASAPPVVTSSSAFAPLLTPGAVVLPSAPPIQIPSLNYDPRHALLPDPKLTPGDALPAVTAADICTPGWASEHRHVTESMRDQVYAEYGRTRGPDCCEVDHLIPLELGGSNGMKNLWPQPDAPRPGWAEKDQLENELHAEVCAGKLPLADAQHCIASNWVACWEQHVVPGYGPEWAAENRHGW
jgi:hypothetical protein